MSEHTKALLIMRERYIEKARQETRRFVANEKLALTPEQIDFLGKFVAGCMASAAVDVLKSGV